MPVVSIYWSIVAKSQICLLPDELSGELLELVLLASGVLLQAGVLLQDAKVPNYISA